MLGTAPARLGGVGVVYWERPGDVPPSRAKGFAVTPMRGLTYYDLRGFSPEAS